MNAELEQLITLQAQDLELKHLRHEFAEAPRRVAAAETARAQAEFALAAARQSLAREETLRRSQEVDIAERRNKIARLRKQMETATSAAQITALEHEIHFAEQAIAHLEDDELLSLETTDQLEAARTTAAASLETASAALSAERSASADLTTRHTAAIEVIEAERGTLRTALAATDSGDAALSTYDRIAKAKGTGLSEAVDRKKCTACQMMVRPQRWNDLIGRDHDHLIFTCETCGRMLFHDPRRDAPVQWPAGERLAAATQDSARLNTAAAGPKPTAAAPSNSRLAETA